ETIRGRDVLAVASRGTRVGTPCVEYRERRSAGSSVGPPVQPPGCRARPSTVRRPLTFAPGPRTRLSYSRRPAVTPRHLVWILAASIAAAAAAPARADNLSFTTDFDGDKRVESCSDIGM